ncbi:MAG: toxin-antitoxin system HicB family antitoxin [Anaerovibrio sp.]|nr:toxin-antitoxin system HicB family antitoxin [Anaerovibrio sp.]
MKDLKYYLSLPYKLEILPDHDEGGFAARYPELPGCITCADSLTQLIDNAEDAKKAWLKAALEDGITIAEPATETNYSGQFKLRIPKTLHMSLAEEAKKEGISMNQYCLYLLSKNHTAHVGQ